MSKQVFAGLEVSSTALVLCHALDGKPAHTRHFDNTPSGHAGIVAVLTKGGHKVRVCLESTGTYGLDIALALASAPGVEVMQANPRMTHHFAQARGMLQKTDDLDAQMLLAFARTMVFKPWKKPADSALTLHRIARTVASLNLTRTAEINRRHALQQTLTAPDATLEVTQALIEHLDLALARLRAEAKTIIEKDALLARRFEILTSIPGIAEKSAIAILGELAVLDPDMTAKQWVALAALAPRIRQSGTSLNRRIGVGHAGNKYLRLALFMPALTMVRKIPQMKEFQHRLASRGLKKLQGVIAVMRKSLHLIHALFTQDRTFENRELPASAA